MRLARFSLIALLALLITGCGVFNPRPKMFDVTMLDDNKTIALQLRQRFQLDLNNKYSWHILITNRAVLKQVVDISAIHNIEGIYEGISAGQSILTATGEAICRDDAIPCPDKDLKFKITINVQ